MIVAIDGPAGVGKSTIARQIAERTGMYYINSGNLYRAITWQILQKYSDNPFVDQGKMIQVAENCRFELNPDGLYVSSQRVEDYLHTDAVDAWVAQVSSISEIRSIVNQDLRKIASGMESVVEGRDITTVVFPDAKVKIFLDASVETRAKRRYHQGISELSIEEIAQRIRQRDQIDRTKAVGRLEVAKDAIYLDTSDLTIDQVCEKVIDKIRKTVQ
jgi:cytidylate kinase